MLRKGDNMCSLSQHCSVSKLQVIGKKYVFLYIYPLRRDLQPLNVLNIGLFCSFRHMDKNVQGIWGGGG